MPTTILLASKDRYYIYQVETDELQDAGSTLEEVYYGLRRASSYDLIGDAMPYVPAFVETYCENYCYFPDYDWKRKLMWEVIPFHPQWPRKQLKDAEDNENIDSHDKENVGES
jgi:hypothetical protein